MSDRERFEAWVRLNYTRYTGAPDMGGCPEHITDQNADGRYFRQQVRLDWEAFCAGAGQPQPDYWKTLRVGGHAVIAGYPANMSLGKLMAFENGKWLVGIKVALSSEVLKDAAWIEPERLRAMGDFSESDLRFARSMAKRHVPPPTGEEA